MKGGAGKTFLTVGLVAALRRRGYNPAVFKKGPDYIDAGWLGLAAGRSCSNLDSYLFDNETLLRSFVSRSVGHDLAIVEGNRGLFDGVDSEGSFSTGELAKLLAAPVVLIVDATKTTRTAAAMVLGCRVLDSGVNLKAVILNRVGGARHEKILRQSIEEATSVPVIGSVRKLPLENFPQRHLGLLPLYEHPKAAEFVVESCEVVGQSVDLDRLTEIASNVSGIPYALPARVLETTPDIYSGVRIGVLRDSAFQFYYPENLDALRSKGAQLVELSALEKRELPEVDGLYIGGGFPETHSERLAENLIFKSSLLRAVEKGLPVYAECGGLIYLSSELRVDENIYPMVGVFPMGAVMERKPQGHGYIQVQVTEANPFYPPGTTLTGHEFHYSYVTGGDKGDARYVFRVLRGHGMDGTRDGICFRNVLGTYVHVHALGTPAWAEGILRSAAEFRAAHRDATPDTSEVEDRIKAL